MYSPDPQSSGEGLIMGKRSNFKRIPRDFYPTPIDAVRPLVAHLPASAHYAEPCYGDGALVRSLEELTGNLWCVWESDIEGGRGASIVMDALDILLPDLSGVDLIITNPPWDRKILHPMIEHFSAMRPTWLLFDADWMHTKQASPYMPWLRKVVSVGRVKWIPGSKMTGKDNCAWYLFDQRSTGPIEFIGRAAQ